MSKLQTTTVIKYAAYEVLQNGYVKRSEDEENCTANKILEAIELNSISDDELNSVKDRVQSWFEYINDSNQSGEYYDNVRAEVTKPMIDENKIALIASSFSSFDKYASFAKLKEKDKASDYLGEEGDKVTFSVRDYRLVKTGTSKFGNNSSKWFLYNIHDDNGNVIVYFSDHNLDFEFKHSDKISAVISKLSEYKGIKQTSISKVKFCDE